MTQRDRIAGASNLLGIPATCTATPLGDASTSTVGSENAAGSAPSNFSGINPLRGPYKEEDGPRFPDQTEIYKKNLRGLLETAAGKAEVDLKNGVYIWFSGPSYETPAEVRAARALGADAVGMSTVPEAMVANRLGMQVCGVSMISNMAAGITDDTLTHEEVLASADLAAQNFRALFTGFMRELSDARD